MNTRRHRWTRASWGLGLLLCTVASVAEAGIDDGLVAHYPFSGSAMDATGNGHDGLVVGDATLTTDRMGNVDSAYSFDGVGDAISLGQMYFTSGDFSIALWINSSSNANHKKIFARGYAYEDQQGDIVCAFHDGRVDLTVRYRSAWVFGWDPAILGTRYFGVGVWHHLAVTKEDDTYRVYLDGVLEDLRTTSAPVSDANNTHPLTLGLFENDGAGNDFAGSLDDVRVYERALSDEEVSQLFSGVCEDADGDGVCDEQDNCLIDWNPDQVERDGDGIGDVCDECPLDNENDIDDDGICGNVDTCPYVAGPQLDSDNDGLGNICDDDDDDDGYPDEEDNCPLDPNDQLDSDFDGVGDVCDMDADGDGVLDAYDQCLGTTYLEVVNWTGCSVDDLCLCDNPWKNHGAYVRCVAQTSEEFVADELFSEEEKDVIVSSAAESICRQKE